MKRNMNTYVILGVFTVLSILLALPFTPLRVSFENITSNYVDMAAGSIGVDYKSQLKIARAIAQAPQYDGSNFELGASPIRRKVVRMGDYTSYRESGGQDYMSVYQGNVNLQKKGGSMGAGGALYANAARRENASGTPGTINGIKSVKTNLQETPNTPTKSTKQTANSSSDNLSGGTHPGYDPQNQLGSLPVGDGSFILISLALIFGVFKMRKSVL